ncbi:TonB-dependent receptor family protein [Cupriavidus consociatus]|uniref:TonB-dependent receptor family protein n=1 Tax=Cupriavidus consociatus TaxID=2821357 RepID=UPI001AEAFE10|nr:MULTISPECIES: TonB-dependent receptor [unclassified Cupriavidus]MBP0619681.1 TonB-dependent receptor [Cupriavidus sp. LEh25]MDK2656332.1 TonB-dependent receptor [Cupriavidus sp. LEh21]
MRPGGTQPSPAMHQPRPCRLAPVPKALALAILLLACTGVRAADAPDSAVAAATGETLPDIVVTATRSEQRRFDAPAAVDSVPVDPLRSATPLVNLSEVLAGVPGVAVRDRQNYSQDLQLAVRGFGTRSTFGVRGVRLYVDGIPATMPDGQGQASTADLANAGRVEVLRGPFAQMYGNASGGVVHVFTPDPPKDGFTARASTGFGSDGQWQAGVALAGGNERLGGSLDAWTYQTDGYRDHSAARRYQFNARVVAQPASGTRVSGQFNYFNQPLAQDPLGLTRAQADASPRQAVPAATQFDTGKNVEQAQAGVVVEHRLTDIDSLSGRLYGGTRNLYQRLGFSGAAPTSSGGIVDLDRIYGGGALSWSRRATAANGLPLLWTAGVEANGMRDGRNGYVNQDGSQGALRRDETNTATDLGAFAQVDWTFHPAWQVVGGVRASRVRLGIDDQFITAASPDDSGTATYSNVSPVLGLVWHALDTMNVYANLGRGFETPTLTEVAYGPGGVGSNLGLRASTSRQGEIGIKWQAGGQRLEAALFDADSHDEVVPQSNNAGRTVYQNVNGVRRRGFELGWRGGFLGQVGTPGQGGGSRIEAGLAYTWLDAYFGDAFVNAQGQTVPAGNRLPGTARHSVSAEVAWRPLAPLTLGAEMRLDSRVYADDLNTQAAPGYAVFNLRAGYEFRIGPTRAYLFGRIDNVTDRRYIGSVIVNEANGRYFEPAPGRRFFIGLRAAL